MPERVDLGDRVRDRDNPDSNPAVVVNTPDVTADEWDVPGRGTVADDPTNDAYAANDPVIIVVFDNEIAEHELDVDDLPLALTDLNTDGVPFYAFPEPRLERLDHTNPASEPEEPPAPEPEPEPSPELSAIADRLRAGGMTVSIDPEANLVRAEKLGEDYVVTPTGAVEGGALRDRVKDAVAEVVP